MIFRQFKVGTMGNFCYVLGDDDSRGAAVVDPHGELDRIIAFVQERGLRVKYIINTHTHWDHVAGNEELKKRTGGVVVTHVEGKVPRDMEVEHDDIIPVGRLEIRVLHTPGHSPDSISLLVDVKLLTGDTLFVGECGRTDLPGGDSEKMYHSLFDVILSMDDDVEVYPGHDYGPHPFSTIGHERETNYTLESRTKEEFIAFMSEP